MSQLPAELSVEEASVLLQGTEKIHLLDVREPDEVAIAKIADSVHIPMAEIPVEVLTKLPNKEARIVVYCHHGMRSQRIAEYLGHLGYSRVQNMSGGIEEWAVKVDLTMARY